MMDNIRGANNCVVQCRVSTPGQAQEGESLEVQEATLRRFVATKGWNIVPNGSVWKSALSGRTIARADFEEILAFIKSHPRLVQYYVFRSIDRATRAGTTEYGRMKEELLKLGVQMVDTYGVIQPSLNTLSDLGFHYPWSSFSPSEITENVLSTTAKQEVTTILTRLMGQEIRLTQQGYRTRRAADGYLNAKVVVEGKRRPVQVPDPKRAPFVIAMFELRAQGVSDPQIVRRLNAMGYRTPIRQRWNAQRSQVVGRRGGRPLTVKKLQQDILNPIYAGVLCEKWTHYRPVRAQYQGLVSIALWNRANQGRVYLEERVDGSIELTRSSGSKTGNFRRRDNPLFPLKFILCPLCRKDMRGSESRSKSGRKVPYYHCSRPGHPYLGIPKATFENKVSAYVRRLRFDPAIIPVLEAAFLDKYRERVAEIDRASEAVKRNAADLEAEQALKVEAYSRSESTVVRQLLEREIEALDARIKEAGSEGVSMRINRDDIKSFMREVKPVLEHPHKALLGLENPHTQRELFRLVFEKMPTYRQCVVGTPKRSMFVRVFSRPVRGKNPLVHLRSLSWNTLEKMVLHWREVRGIL